MLEALNTDILVSLFEWFDRESVLDLDSAYTNQKLRPLYLSLISRKECIVDLDLKLSVDIDQSNNLAWMYKRCISLSRINLFFYEELELSLLQEDNTNNNRKYVTYLDSTVSVLCQYCSHIQTMLISGFMMQHWQFFNNLNIFQSLTALSLSRSILLTDDDVRAMLSLLPYKDKLTSIDLFYVDLLTSDTLYHFATICRKLKKLTLESNNIWQQGQIDARFKFEQLAVISISTIDFDVQAYSETLKSVLSYSTHLTDLTLPDCLLQYVKESTNLIRLHVSDVTEEQTSLQLLRLITSTVKLTSLTFNDCDISDNVYNALAALNLKLLYFEATNSSPGLVNFVASLSYLQSFIYDGEEVDWSLLISALCYCHSSLTSLTLNNYENYEGENDTILIRSLLSQCSQLKHLNIYLEASDMNQYKNMLPCLESVSLSYANGNDMIELLQYLPLLEKIDARVLSDIDVILISLTRIPNKLYELRSHRHSGLTGKGYKALLEGECCLKFLYTGNSGKTDREFQDDINHYKDLLKDHKPKLKISY